MAKVELPLELKTLIQALKHLPGLGPKSAERLAVWMVKKPGQRISPLVDILQMAKENLGSCPRCGFYSNKGEWCGVCQDTQRDGHLLCVVEQSMDVIKMERTNAFKGYYHVLGGKLAPLDHVSPEDLNIDYLVQRVQQEGITEVVLATSADVEGEATASYLAERLKPCGVMVTRLAKGMPSGGGLEWIDDSTLVQAIKGRHQF
jgi:recombination protein RecR